MAKKSNKVFSDKQEKSIADFLDWQQVKGSGARPIVTGDVECDSWLGECKTHTTPDHKIHFDSKIWSKIVDEAAAKFRFAAYFVDDGSQKLNRTWVIFSMLDISHKGKQFAPLPSLLSKRTSMNTLNFSHYELAKGAVYKIKLGDSLVLLSDISTFREVIRC